MNAVHGRFASKRVLVTGGSTGIGREVVRLLADEGARVVTFGREKAALCDMIADLQPSDGQVEAFPANVVGKEGIRDIFTEVDRHLGGLDILIVCAAVGAEPIHEMSDEGWREVVDINLVGAMACARAALDRMLPQGSGHLLFVGSITTDIKAKGESVYAATKAGLQAFAETLRKEIAENNIKVTLIQPGAVATDMQQASLEDKRDAVEARQMLDARDVAETILFAVTRPSHADLVMLRIEPCLQKTH